MITKLEIDGFKSFSDLEMEFAPLQVIIGPNGAGKSNLFDALRLLSRLTQKDLRKAFQDLRGEAGELFALGETGASVNQMRFAVEMMVDPQIQDSWGAEEDLKHTRLRYELKIERRPDEQDLERFYVVYEKLDPIKRKEDEWIKRYGISYRNWLPKLHGGRGTPFISTSEEPGKPTLYLHQDGRAGRKASVAEAVESTVLSNVVDAEFPHAFAAREEMRGWDLLQLNPEVLRMPSAFLNEPKVAPDGKNLSNALARLEKEDAHLLSDISRDLSNLVPGILGVRVTPDEAKEQYVIEAKTEDECAFSSRVLSDGTLRALTLATLKNDPEHHGVLMFEEPENGIHALRLRKLVSLLSDMTTDFSDVEQQGGPLRQLLMNTHSPVLVKHLIEKTAAFSNGHTSNGRPSAEGCPPNIVLAYMTSPVSRGTTSMSRVTRFAPINPRADQELPLENKSKYTLNEVTDYLKSADTSRLTRKLRGEQVG